MFDAAENAAVIAVLAAVWASASLALASFVGGAVAAFASGLRRAADGVLHGAVAWAASMLLVAVAAIAVGPVIGGQLGWGKLLLASLAASRPDAEINLGADAGAMDRVRAQLRAGNRAEAIAMLQRDFGITAQQANTVVNRLSVPAAGAMHARSSARRWIPLRSRRVALGTILLSLGTALGGGALGVKGHKAFGTIRACPWALQSWRDDGALRASTQRQASRLCPAAGSTRDRSHIWTACRLPKLSGYPAVPASSTP